MARRFYLVPIDGDGLTPESAYRARGARTNGFWPDNAQARLYIARERCRFAFIEADTTTAEHAAIIADPDIYAIPVGPMDSAMNGSARSNVASAILSKFSESVAIPAGTTWRQLLHAVARRVHPAAEIV